MERAQMVSKFVLFLHIIFWVVSIEGIADFWSVSHTHSFFRRILYLALGRDPFYPRRPTDWEEWYYS
jgi:hypothetical protein